MDWYISVLKRFSDFTSRARRKEYWMFVLFNMIIAFVLGIIDGILGLRMASGIGILGGLYLLVILVPSIAVGIRRLHDRDMSGWFMLLAFVPIVGGIALLVIFCLEGTPGSNKYGPDPKGVAA